MEELLDAIPEGWLIEHSKRAGKPQYSKRSSYARHLVGVKDPDTDKPWVNSHLPHNHPPLNTDLPSHILTFTTAQAAMASTDDWLDEHWPEKRT